MGLFKKIGSFLLQGALNSTGVKCRNPYMGLILQAEDNDLITDDMFRASLAYQYGQYGLRKDSDKTIEYCCKAAEDGLDSSQFYLAQMYYEGNGVEKNVNKVLEWVEKSLHLGNSNARGLFSWIIMSNDLQNLLSDKVMRGTSYKELSMTNPSQVSNG